MNEQLIEKKQALRPAKVLSEVIHCNGTRIIRDDAGKATVTRVEKDLSGCITRNTGTGVKYDPARGPALDIRSTDIVNYRTFQMREK
jgi:hypothetical protein